MMAVQGLLPRRIPELKPFEVHNVEPTGVKLGTGAYGEVEEVRIPGAICAAKKLHEILQNSATTPQEERRISDTFLRECTLLSRLRHPHIVQFLGVCYLPGSHLPLLVMERLLMSLDELLETKTIRLPFDAKLSFLRDVANGLLFLHSQNPPVIHRDLTARNVLLNTSMVAKIADLGVAKIVNIQPSKMAATMTKNPGNVVYMPPESAGEYSTPLDIFSYGNLAIYTLSCKFPDLEKPTYLDSKTQRLIARSEVERRYDVFQHLYQELGKEHDLVRLSKQCLSNNPKERPSAYQVSQQLARVNPVGRDWKKTKLELLQDLEVLENEQVTKEQDITDLNRQLDELQKENQSLYQDVASLNQQVQLLQKQVELKEQAVTQVEFATEISSPTQFPSSMPTIPPRYGAIRRIGDHDQFQRNQYYPGQQPVLMEHDNIHRHQQFKQSPPEDQHLHPLQQMQRMSSNPQFEGVSAVTVPPGDDLPTAIALGFEIGSTIQIQPADPTQLPRYGVIKWIGDMPNIVGLVAGIELDEYMEGCSDGTWQQTGQRYFDCPQGKGIFCPVSNLKKDERFYPDVYIDERGNPLDYVPHWEEIDQCLKPHPQQMLKYIGEGKGIQGHQNSCYLDATVFGLFALSDVFETMLLVAHEAHKTAHLNRKVIEDMLWKGIINPLRKNGVVRYESVMMLRSKLDELGKMEMIAQDEKDPEEFLNMLFKHVLCVDPFIEIRRPFGTEKEFFVQLFVEFDENMRLPTIGDLLRKMFKEQNISFTEMPSLLLIQVPRYGKQFKTFQKIVPDLKLRVMDLTDTYQNATIPNCFVCGDQKAAFKCVDCRDHFNVYCETVNLCDGCDKMVHAHKDRADHPPRQIFFEGVSELGLLSVICIETSHYVCFAKDPYEDPDHPLKWIFFDSMANKVYDTYYIPKVADCTAELNEWVYPSNGDHIRLMSTPSKNLPEYVRHFTQDIYMCVYVHPDVSMYG